MKMPCILLLLLLLLNCIACYTIIVYELWNIPNVYYIFPIFTETNMHIRIEIYLELTCEKKVAKKHLRKNEKMMKITNLSYFIIWFENANVKYIHIHIHIPFRHSKNDKYIHKYHVTHTMFFYSFFFIK